MRSPGRSPKRPRETQSSGLRIRKEHRSATSPRSIATAAGTCPVPPDSKACACSNGRPACSSCNERSMLSLGICDPDIEIGTEVTVVWGEPNGGSQKATVERHKQLEIRATVSPVPYAAVVRDTYAEGWRSTGKA